MTPGILIEGLIIVLLVATIAYCAVLSGRLKRLKSDESALRSTIAELLTATELAERAIQGLKVSANENQKTLTVRVRDAERLNVELRAKLDEGGELMNKLVAITQVAPRANAPKPNAQKTVQKAPAQERKVASPPPVASPRRVPPVRPNKTSPRSVSDLAAEATARINAMRAQRG